MKFREDIIVWGVLGFFVGTFVSLLGLGVKLIWGTFI